MTYFMNKKISTLGVNQLFDILIPNLNKNGFKCKKRFWKLPVVRFFIWCKSHPYFFISVKIIIHHQPTFLVTAAILSDICKMEKF